MSASRVVFSKARQGVIWGLSVSQIGTLGIALLMGLLALQGGPRWWVSVVALLLLITLVLARFRGRPLADLGPALAAEGASRLMGLHIYRGGPVRANALNAAGKTRNGKSTVGGGEPLVLPGALGQLSIESYEMGDGRPPVAVVRDAADGTISAVLAVVGSGMMGADDPGIADKSEGFMRALNALSRGASPVVCIQLMHGVIPDEGDEVWRQLRRANITVRHAGPAYNGLLEAAAGTGIQHVSYVTVRLDPSRDKARLREYGGGPAAEMAIAVEAVAGLERDLRAAGVIVTGWLPARAVAAVIRSAFDPSSDRMINRRGGGRGDSEGGDSGLPSGVDPAAAGPMYAERGLNYYAHNDHRSRVWWIQQWPRSRQGVPVGFLQPLLLSLPYRHTLTLLLRPVPDRKAQRKVNRDVSSSDARRFLSFKVKGRVSREDQREAQDIDRRERELVEGNAAFEVSGLVSVTARGVDQLEAITPDVESALNQCSLEAQRWIIETDQAFACAALPLARGGA